MLYSPEYQHQQEMMHQMPRGYGGVHSRTYAPPILDDIDRFRPEAVRLDYGAGKGPFGEMLFKAGYRGEYRPYDPGIPYWSAPPDPAPYVICIDVLEHIEPDCLDDVLRLVRERLHRLLAEHRLQLPEAFAETIADILIGEFGASWVRVKVVKPRKFDDVQAVGVQIERFAAEVESPQRGAAVLHLIGSGMVPGGR